MAKAVSTAPGESAGAVVLAEPTCSALGLPPSQPTPRDVAAGALRLLDPGLVSELAKAVAESLDDLIVGVVEAVQECVLSPPLDCADLGARAEVEAASWVDDFIADNAIHDDDVVSQQAMFQLACLVADAVAEELTARPHARSQPNQTRCRHVDARYVHLVVGELRRRGMDAARWSVRLARSLGWLRR